MTHSRDLLQRLYHAAVEAADPYRCVIRSCDEIRAAFTSGGFSRLVVTGFGKASPAMALAVEDALGDILDSGVIVTRYGHGHGRRHARIEVLEAGHPMPDENGITAAERIISLAGRADSRTLVVCLISGGGSSLFAAPCRGVSLRHKQATTDLLLKCGADIGELNTVRKHLSRVKGGRLAEIIYPAATYSLVLSDVPGDRLDVAASGPTAPDPTTYADALAVLVNYDLLEKVPQSVAEQLAKGSRGLIPETPKPGSQVFAAVVNRVVGNNLMALEAARDMASALGLRSAILCDDLSGEARAAGRQLAGMALAAVRSQGRQVPFCLISGGETTVRVTGSGKGGRNMELALSFALEIEGTPGISILSAGTDGTDGPTDAAGAFADGTTTASARARGIDPESHLDQNDSYNFFRKAGGLFTTGPTGTNVMDIQLVLVEGSGPA